MTTGVITIFAHFNDHSCPQSPNTKKVGSNENLTQPTLVSCLLLSLQRCDGALICRNFHAAVRVLVPRSYPRQQAVLMEPSGLEQPSHLMILPTASKSHMQMVYGRSLP